MEDLHILLLVGVLLLVLVIENEYPGTLNIIGNRLHKVLKDYWKALKEWESGN